MRALIIVVAALLAGCGPELISASFTSRIVQHDTCKVVGDRPETCTREESTTDLRVRVAEREDNNVWLYGITRSGISDRALLGTRDADGGFLFIDEVVQENTASACTLVDRLEISIAIDAEAPAESVGSDPCTALLGRETETTVSSSGCDAVNEPPLSTTLVARRRWERAPDCATLGDD